MTQCSVGSQRQKSKREFKLKPNMKLTKTAATVATTTGVSQDLSTDPSGGDEETGFEGAANPHKYRLICECGSTWPVASIWERIAST
jgi:hypothetical protein